ncbi:MAG: SMC-Scp complex subunit ScpB [Gammaproteobacteria bacterium]|jgi:segregation and condensation protein B
MTALKPKPNMEAPSAEAPPASAVTPQSLKPIVEAALLAAGRPLRIEDLQQLFAQGPGGVDRAVLRVAIDALQEDCAERGVELTEVASGFRFQVKAQHAPWVNRLWAERPTRYTRALLETLALIAYRQPITRGEIEDVRGVSVSSSILKTLLEREWIRVLGHRDVPGRPALYGTTRRFLDHFNLKNLDELPPLAQIRELGQEPASPPLQEPVPVAVSDETE